MTQDETEPVEAKNPMQTSAKFCEMFALLRAGLIQAVRKKQLIRTWLCG